MPEPGQASGDPGAKTVALKNAILERGIVLETVDDLDGALGTSSGGCIRLLNGLSPATEFTTLVHEYAHLCSAVRYVRSGQGEIAPCSAMWSTMTTQPIRTNVCWPAYVVLSCVCQLDAQQGDDEGREQNGGFGEAVPHWERGQSSHRRAKVRRHMDGDTDHDEP